MKKMTEFQINWIKALASGKYKRTTRTMRDELGFCCLGVAQDLYPENQWEHIPEKGNYRTTMGEATYPRTAFPHNSVIIALGLETANVNMIANINDSLSPVDDRTFDQMIPHIIRFYEEAGYDTSPLQKAG